MDYKETVELEKNIEIKNKADFLYKEFHSKVCLNVKDYKDGRFKFWSDCHNASYIKIIDNTFVVQYRFLHESYDVPIDKGSLFELIKNKYRGIEHLEAYLKHEVI